MTIPRVSSAMPQKNCGFLTRTIRGFRKVSCDKYRTYEYKVKHSGKYTDWEKVKTKYADILALFREQLPSGTEEASQLEDYPHHLDQITLKCLTCKLKAIYLKYRQAIDSGKKSGSHCQSSSFVCLCFYDISQHIEGFSNRYLASVLKQ